ncbi:MAG: cation diffusion facilitator family transporter [Chloroflexota bacterium]
MSTHLHVPQSIQATRRLALSLALTAAFVVIEAFAGWWANSLALLTDAGHNFTDVLALGLSWFAVWLTTQPATSGRTYGHQRAGILAALVNSTSLAVISIGVFYEAYKRFVAPPAVQADILVGVGFIAFLVNAVTAWLVHKGSDHDLNLRSAFVHLMGDVLSTIGAVIAGAVILFTGWNFLDPLVGVLIGLLILWNAWTILRETLDILLENAPRDVEMSSLTDDLLNVDGVRGVHHVHVWSINRSLRALSAHVLTDDISVSEGAFVQQAINNLLFNKYNIGHATLQLECAECDPDVMYCLEVNVHERAEQ